MQSNIKHRPPLHLYGLALTLLVVVALVLAVSARWHKRPARSESRSLGTPALVEPK